MNTWVGWAGPGIEKNGDRNEPWNESADDKHVPFTDHTDVRPTILALTGLQDDYVSDGRVVTDGDDVTRCSIVMKSWAA